MNGGRRRLTGIDNSVDISIGLVDYIGKHEGGLITAIKNDSDNMGTNRMTISRKRILGRKNGHFIRLINNIMHKKTLKWQRKINLKRETESLRIAAKNNAVRTNHIKAKTDNTQKIANIGYVVIKMKPTIT